MLTPNATLRSAIFWQWANQTLNVAVSCFSFDQDFPTADVSKVNFSNANKSIEMTPQEIGTGGFAIAILVLWTPC